MNSQFDNILAETHKIFIEHGIKSISMADLASIIHVSKKTIYKYVSNKEDLIQTLFLEYIPDIFLEVQKEIQEKAENAIEVFVALQEHIFSLSGFMSEKMQFDLKTFHPFIFEKYEQKLHSLLYSFYKTNIESGITEGVYKSFSNSVAKAELFTQFSLNLTHSKELSILEITNEFKHVYITSLATSSGLETYYKTTNQAC